MDRLAKKNIIIMVGSELAYLFAQTVIDSVGYCPTLLSAPLGHLSDICDKGNWWMLYL